MPSRFFLRAQVTLTAFGMAVWSCVLRGEIDAAQSTYAVSDGEGNSRNPFHCKFVTVLKAHRTNTSDGRSA